MGRLNGRLRVQILERDGYRCVYCGRGAEGVALHVDHVVPRIAGGSDVPHNLVTACFDCNNGKRDHLIALPDHVDLAKPLTDTQRPGGSRPRRRSATSESRIPIEHHWSKVASMLAIDGPFPIGRFFIREYALTEPIEAPRWRLETSYHQGIVVSITDGAAWVRCFSQLDGRLSDSTIALPAADWAGWRFFETDVAMRRWSFEWGVAHGLWDGGEEHWRQCESVVASLAEFYRS